MRNLTAGNKMNFTMFIFIILIIIFMIILATINGLKNIKDKYEISSSSCIYDNKSNYIELENDALISKKWTGNYYLKEDITKKEYKLGNYSIAFNKNKRSLDLFGTFYEVKKGGDVLKISDYNYINNTMQDKFYKIDDRKYLIIGKKIKNNTGSLSTENYLIIILDKSGNALLLNNQINAKTINEMIINTDDFEFDVAKEILKYSDDIINLKKIIGSSNQYVQRASNTENEKKEENKTENSIKENVQSNNEQTLYKTSSTSSTTTVTETSTLKKIEEENTSNKDNIESSSDKFNENDQSEKEEKIDNNKENDKNDKDNKEKTENIPDRSTEVNKSDNNNTENKSDKSNEPNKSEKENTEEKSDENNENDKLDKESKNTNSGKSNDKTNLNKDVQDLTWVETLNNWMSEVATGFKNINGTKNEKKEGKLSKNISLNGLNAGTTFIEINYTVTDPENQYNVVYAIITGNNFVKTISLDKNANTYRVTELEPNTNYTVEMGYKIIYSDSSVEEVKQDIMTARTLIPNEELKITRVSLTKIYYSLKLDHDYVYDNGCKIKIYLNDTTLIFEQLLSESNLEKAAITGYNDSFQIPQGYKEKNAEIKILLEETCMDGKSVPNSLVAKTVNY